MTKELNKLRKEEKYTFKKQSTLRNQNKEKSGAQSAGTSGIDVGRP